MFLVLFTALFGNEEIAALGVTTAQFYAPALAVFGAASATYTNLSITTAISRDEGILKKVRGTPLPPSLYIAGRVGSAVWIALIAVIIMMTVGAVVYGVDVRGATFAAAALSFVLGAAAFAAVGLMVAALVPNGTARRRLPRPPSCRLPSFLTCSSLRKTLRPGWKSSAMSFRSSISWPLSATPSIRP